MDAWHRVSRETVCPLGQPEKAIGEQSQIESWLALHNHTACRVETEGHRYDITMELGATELKASHRNTGLDDEIASSRRGSVFLDIPFYRTGFSETGESG